MKPYKKQIFIAHPHPIVAISLEYLIEGEKDLVVCGKACDYNETLKLISKSNPDLAVVDIFMNNGHKCIVADVRKESSSLPILVVSELDESLYLVNANRKFMR